MPSQTPAEELPPYSLETIPPSTAEEAFTNLVRFVAWKNTRAEAIELIEAMDPSKVVHAVQGRTVSDQPLSGFELMVGHTVEYCARKGLLRGPLTTVGIIEYVRQMVKGGEIFIGQERTPEEKRQIDADKS